MSKGKDRSDVRAGKLARTDGRGPRASKPTRPEGAIALTGVNTFLGRSLVAHLERSRSWRRVVAIDLRNASTAGPKTRFYKVDLTQPAVDAQLAEILHAERVDTVVHGAFLGVPSHAAAWAHELESVGTMHVLGACEECGIRKLVLRSHTMLYGARSDNPLYLTERRPLLGNRHWPFIGDKVDAEEQVAAYGERHPGSVVTVLRTAPTVGPTVRNLVTEMLRWPVVPMVLGYDPLVQLLHELDMVAAFRTAIEEDHSGRFNIVGSGVLPLASIVRLAGRVEVPMPYPVARAVLQLLFSARLWPASPDMLDYIRHPFVAAGERAEEVMGFRASYSTVEALGDFVRSMRQRSRRRALVASRAATREGM